MYSQNQLCLLCCLSREWAVSASDIHSCDKNMYHMMSSAYNNSLYSPGPGPVKNKSNIIHHIIHNCIVFIGLYYVVTWPCGIVDWSVDRSSEIYIDY